MQLNLEQIQSISQGAVRAAKTENGVSLYRFTKKQEELYENSNTKKRFHKNTFTSAGMRLCFETDSKFLFLKVNVTKGGSRNYFSFDVLVNGKVIGYLDNFSDVILPKNYTEMELLQGEFSKMFELGDGVKRVCVYLPWSVAVEIRELSVEDNAFIKPVKPKKTLLAFGDSISQGYDALRPSQRYLAKLAEKLHAEEINKCIGGEVFFPALAEAGENLKPDYIVVAYGTNDWSTTEEEDFKNRCRAFFTALSKNYPASKIYAITPIWRKDYMELKGFGDFLKTGEDIQSIVEEFENIVCIQGFELIAHDEDYFADLRLHPNDKGFDCYFRNLCKFLE